MSGSAKSGSESGTPGKPITNVAAASDTPRGRCLHSAQAIVRLNQAWSRLFEGGLRSANFATAHILMSAATVYLNEMTSALHSSTSDDAERSEKARHLNEDQASPFPLADDYGSREEYGRNRIHEDILPLLQDMGQYRPAPKQLEERLLKAMGEREDLIREHKRRQQGFSIPSPSRRGEQKSLSDDSDMEKSARVDQKPGPFLSAQDHALSTRPPFAAQSLQDHEQPDGIDGY